MTAGEFEPLWRAAQDSLIGRLAAAGAGHLTSAWSASRTAAAMAIPIRRWRTLTPAERLASSAVMLGTAWLGYAALLMVVPPYVATGIPAGWFVGLGVALLGVAAIAPLVAPAWTASRVAHVMRWLRD